MPAMTYTLQWPDASRTSAYSPSLVIQDLFTPGEFYAVADFLARVREATRIANERVYAKFGFECSHAGDQLAVLEAQAGRFTSQPGAQVQVVSFGPAA